QDRGAVYPRRRALRLLLQILPVRPAAENSIQELSTVVIAAHPEVGTPIETHGVQLTRNGELVGRSIHDCGITKNDGNLPRVDCAATHQTGLLIVGSGKNQRPPLGSDPRLQGK